MKCEYSIRWLHVHFAIVDSSEPEARQNLAGGETGETTGPDENICVESRRDGGYTALERHNGLAHWTKRLLARSDVRVPHASSHKALAPTRRARWGPVKLRPESFNTTADGLRCRPSGTSWWFGCSIPVVSPPAKICRSSGPQTNH